MHICYIDEAGGFEASGSSALATPLMVIAGLVLDHQTLPAVTDQYLRLKAQFFPGKVRPTGHLLDYVLAEVKGSDLRAGARSSSRDRRRHAVGFLDETVRLLSAHAAVLLGRVWVKAPGQALNPRSSYTFAIQDLALHFERFLTTRSDLGFLLCDSRLHHQDAQVSHSVFTQKHKLTGDSYPHIVEATVFGGSQNHVGLQLADIVASALLFPMAARTYCPGSGSPHAHPRFDAIKKRYAATLRPMQYRYRDGANRSRGGVVVSDRVGHRPSRDLFQ